MSNFSSTYPAIRPTYQIDFSNGKRIPPNATFSRSDSPIDATKAAASAVHFWSNEKHLSDENYATYSEQFDQWTQVGMSDTANATAAPDGNTTADLLYPTAASAYAWQGNLLAYGTTRQKCCSFYVKANSWTWIAIGVNGGAAVWFNIATGTKGTESSGYTGTITAVGSTGWYRVSVEGNDVTPLAPIIYLVDADGGVTATPSGTNGVYVWGCKAELGVTTPTAYVTATGSQLLREYAPTLKSVATAGAARFEYDPTDGQSMGVLIESQTQNLNSYSEDFSHGNYNKYDGSLETNAAIAPDGSLTADLFVEDTGTSTHYISKAVSTGLSVGSTQYAISVFAKAAGRSQMQMYDNGQSTPGTTVFDLANGTVLSGGGYIEACGNGWYRCTVIPTADYGTTGTPTIVLHNGSATSYQGDGYSGVLLWGLQLETGNGSGTSFSSSYIGTTTTSATRASDNLSVATADIPGFSEGVGTVVYETGGVASATGVQLAFTLFSASNSYITAGVNAGGSSDTSVRVYVIDPAGDQAWFSAGTATVGTGYKLACRYELDNVAASFNGGAVVSDTSGKVPVNVTSLKIGNGYASNYHLNSNLKRIAVYNEALSDTNLQSLTAS